MKAHRGGGRASARRAGPAAPAQPQDAPGLKRKLRLMLAGYGRGDPAAVRRVLDPASSPRTPAPLDLMDTSDSDYDFVDFVPHAPRDRLAEAVEGTVDANPTDSNSGAESDTSAVADDSLSDLRESPDDSEDDLRNASDLNESENEVVLNSQTYKSFENVQDVSDMMREISNILEDDLSINDTSFVNVSLEDLERSPHDISSFVPVDSSMDDSTGEETSSSSIYFDESGQLASCIFEKLNTKNEELRSFNTKTNFVTNPKQTSCNLFSYEGQTEDFFFNFNNQYADKPYNCNKSSTNNAPDVEFLAQSDHKNLKKLNERNIKHISNDINKNKKTDGSKQSTAKITQNVVDISIIQDSDTQLHKEHKKKEINKLKQEKAIMYEAYKQSENDFRMEDKRIRKLKKSNLNSRNINKPKNKIKSKDLEQSPPFVSMNMDANILTTAPNLFENYTFSTNCNISTENIGLNFLKGHASDLFRCEETLNGAIINEPTEIDTDEFTKENNEASDIEKDIVSDEAFHTFEQDNDGGQFNEEPINSLLQTVGDRTIDEQNFTLSTSMQIKCLKNGCIVILRHPSQIYIHGKLKISALCGNADILGYRLTDKMTEAFAPRYNYALTVRTECIENNPYGLFGKLTGLGLSTAKTEDIVTTLGDFDVVLYLEPLNNKKFEFIDKNFFAANVFNKPNKIINEQFPEAAELLSCSLYTYKPNRCFEENVIWQEVVKSGLDKSSKGIVCGGKGTGKSTFLKYYVNKLLARGPVLVIDLDPGQSEFTVAGNVSVTVVEEPLIGPNFTHLKQPKRTLSIGIINVLDNIERYINAITDLISYCSEEPDFQNMPWIINTMGLCNSLGLKLMIFIIFLARPTFLVQMDSKVLKKTFGMLLTAQEIKKTYLESHENDDLFRQVRWPEDLNFQYYMSSHPKTSGKETNSLSPRDERYLNYLSYFGELVSGSNTDNLLSIRPYVVDLNSMRIGTTCKVADASIKKVLNGKIVALCEDFSSFARTFTLEEKALTCHGHGLIRGIDEENDSLYILTPIPRMYLGQINTLVYSESHLDLILNDCYLAPGTVVPYRVPLQDNNLQLVMAPKRRFNPLLLLKMKRAGTA